MRKRRELRVLARMVVVGLAYYAGAWIGVNGTITPEGIAVIWPPNAVLLSAFLLFPLRQWPLIGLVVLGAELAADLPSFPAWAAVAFGVVNLFEASIAAWLIRRSVTGQFGFDRLHDGIRFLLFGPLLASALAALFGAAIYMLLGRTDNSYWALWRLWWFGDALGLLLLTPLFITLWRHLEKRTWLAISWYRLYEPIALGLIVIVLGMLVFVQEEPEMPGFYFTPILLVPLGIWSAIRFGMLGATMTVTLIAAIGIVHLVNGNYPYPHVAPQFAVWFTQEYLAIVAIVSVGLALLLREISQHNQLLYQHEQELRAHNELLEQRVIARTVELKKANESLQEANRQLEQLANTDFLTRFDNRRHFEEQSQRELRRLGRDGVTASMIMFDLDHFKAINDEYGHEVGDEVLRRINTPVKDSIRPRDVCARIGGEEFGILLSGVGLEEACQVAERIRAGIDAMAIDHRGLSVRITASFGVAEWNNQTDLNMLMSQADAALYRAKKAGRNRVAI